MPRAGGRVADGGRSNSVQLTCQLISAWLRLVSVNVACLMQCQDPFTPDAVTGHVVRLRSKLLVHVLQQRLLRRHATVSFRYINLRFAYLRTACIQ